MEHSIGEKPNKKIGAENIFSAVIHMDERNPHMHLCFVPLTPDNRLSDKMKEIRREIKNIGALNAGKQKEKNSSQTYLYKCFIPLIYKNA